MARIVIRPIRREDFTAWNVLWDGYNAFYGRAGATALPPEITQTTWSRFFDGDEPMHALVAESAGTLLGVAQFLFHRSTTQQANGVRFTYESTISEPEPVLAGKPGR